MQSSQWRECIDLVIGPNKTLISIHQLLLRRFSDFFSASLSEPWVGSERRTIELPNECVEVVQLVCSWIYTKCLLKDGCQLPYIPVADQELLSTDLRWDEFSVKEYTHLCEVYTFADQRLMPGLKNAVIDLLVAVLCLLQTKPIPILALVAANTPRDSALMRLLINFIVMTSDAATLCSLVRTSVHRGITTDDMLVTILDVARRAKHEKALLPLEWVNQLDLCKFHDHLDTTNYFSTLNREESDDDVLSNNQSLLGHLPPSLPPTPKLRVTKKARVPRRIFSALP